MRSTSIYARTGRALRLFALVAAATLGSACSSDADANNQSSSGASATTPVELTLYSGRKADLIKDLLATFEKNTGHKVKLVDGGTSDMAARIETEGEECLADVYFAQDPGYPTYLASKGLLTKLPDDILNSVEAAYRDPNGSWVGASSRARVLVFNPDLIQESQLPKTLKDLADPKFKGRFGWAPSNASLQAHLSALRSLWGEESTKAWLEQVKANDPKVYAKNGAIVEAVDKGEVAFGWVNHYYLHQLKAKGTVSKARNYSFPTAGDAGNVMMVAGAGVVKTTRHKAAAEALVKFLVSPEAQAHYVKKNFEYPTRKDVALQQDLLPLERFSQVKLDQDALRDVDGTRKLLVAVGLQ